MNLEKMPNKGKKVIDAIKKQFKKDDVKKGVDLVGLTKKLSDRKNKSQQEEDKETSSQE